MKVAILGRGKTGSKVNEVALEQGFETTVFHSQNVPTVKALEGHDVIISFLPGPALASYLTVLKEASLPIVSGSTGYDFSNVTDLTWIQGHNYALGMNIIREMIAVLSKATNILGENYSCHIHEVHHVKKLDSPSGTALRWKDWSGLKGEITSERQGDVVGDHVITVKTGSEEITLRHQALDRKIFAEGALWMATKLLNKPMANGFYWFENIVQSELGIKDNK
jgi:4-hydroxy-tetrahydrodipicolinate reductase